MFDKTKDVREFKPISPANRKKLEILYSWKEYYRGLDGTIKVNPKAYEGVKQEIIALKKKLGIYKEFTGVVTSPK